MATSTFEIGKCWQMWSTQDWVHRIMRLFQPKKYGEECNKCFNHDLKLVDIFQEVVIFGRKEFYVVIIEMVVMVGFQTGCQVLIPVGG
jgi:hypothetical protein